MDEHINTDIAVYVTTEDNIFHKSDCDCIKEVQDTSQMSVVQAQEKGYVACEVCCSEYIEYKQESPAPEESNKDISNITHWMICIFITILMCMGFLSMCSDFINNEKEETSYRCGSCGKTFTNQADTKSIAFTNMCEPCYENFKFKQELQEELKKYSERN